MKVDSILIGLLLFGLVFITGMLMVVDVNTNYGTSISTSELSATYYNTTSGIYNITRSARTNIEGADTENIDQDNILKRGYNAIKQVFRSFGIISDVATSLSNSLGIPAFVADIILTIIVTAMVFAIAYFVWGMFR